MTDADKLVRLRLSITFEYDADPHDYSSNDPAMMAAIDRLALMDDGVSLSDMIDLRDLPEGAFTITVVEA